MSTPLRINYLLSDAGIVFSDSRKGCSIHARSMIRAFQQEGCPVETFVLRRGLKMRGFDVREIQHGPFFKLWHKEVMAKKRWRWLLRGQQAPNWMTAVDWLLWHRCFYREALLRMRRNPPSMLYARHAWLAWPYAALKKKLNVPLALEVNAVMSVEKESRGEAAFRRLGRRIEKNAFEAADIILPVSAEIREQILRFDIAPEKVVVMPNGVDLQLFAPSETPVADDAFTIGCVSSFRAYHGLATLLEAAAQLKASIPQIRLLLIGAGPEMENLRAKSRELGLEDCVMLPGIVEHNQVPELLRECSVCVCPNEGDVNQYNCPMKLYEYMALKIPIAASRWGDIPNIVEDGRTGLLHKPGDAADLARCLLDIYTNPAAAAQRAEAAYDVARERSWRNNAVCVLKLLGLRKESPVQARSIASSSNITHWHDSEAPAILPKDIFARAKNRKVISQGFVSGEEVMLATFASACRIMIDEGLNVYSVAHIQSDSNDTVESQAIFEQFLSEGRGALLINHSRFSQVPGRLTIWENGETGGQKHCYIDLLDLSNAVHQLRRFLSGTDDCTCPKNYFEELSSTPILTPPDIEVDERHFRVMENNSKDGQLLERTARNANGRLIVALAPAPSLATAGDMLVVCRALLDEGFSFYLLVIATGSDEEVQFLDETYRTYFTAQEGEWVRRDALPRHVMNKVAVGVCDDGRIEGVELFRMGGMTQPALAWHLRQALCRQSCPASVQL